MERIFALWQIPVPAVDLILFALRGALPVSPVRGWRSQGRVRLAKEDYRRQRCTIGIWSRERGRILLFPGSTVPHHDQVAKAAPKGGRGVNQLEPGFYRDLRRGEHLQGQLRGHAALRQTAGRFYRRSAHLPPYGRDDRLFFGNPYDNLHCAWNPDPAVEGYSSAGCVVVAGLPFCPRLAGSGPNRGPWRLFHNTIYSARQRDYPLLLLPAAQVEQALRAPGTDGGLVFGSEGAPVRRLQAELRAEGFYKGRITGVLDARTYRSLERRRRTAA